MNKQATLHKNAARADAPAAASSGDLKVVESAFELFREYSRERPEVVALWAFGIGFVLGWKLKPW
jgi:hypothetical protein